MKDIGIQGGEIEAAQPNDLIVAVISETLAITENVLGRLDEWLEEINEKAPSLNTKTLEKGLSQKPSANLAVISVPGEYAAREAKKALEAGLNVFLFSDNVSLEDELDLKTPFERYCPSDGMEWSRLLQMHLMFYVRTSMKTSMEQPSANNISRGNFIKVVAATAGAVIGAGVGLPTIA